MKKLLLILPLLILLSVSCKKERICECKALSAPDEDFSYTYKATKKFAESSCKRENDFWSPRWTCTLK